MRPHLTLWLLLHAISGVSQAFPQVAVIVQPGSTQLRLTRKSDPVYPAIARAAHVSGEVKLRLEIATDGHVVGSKVLSGPAMLTGSAQECVKQWVYAPILQEGKRVSATTVATIEFHLPAPAKTNDEEIAAKFFPLDRACIKAVSSGSDTAQQAQLCSEAAQVAETFGSEERFIERRGVFVYAAMAYSRNKQPEQALDYASKAVAVVEQGHDDGSGSSAAYSVRAQAEAQLGDLSKASDDLTKAEEFERAAIEKIRHTTRSL